MKKQHITILFILILFSCKKDDHNTVTPYKYYWFTGMEKVKFDSVKGKYLQTWLGKPDDDWKVNTYKLTSQQSGLLNIDTTAYANWNTTEKSDVEVQLNSDNPISLQVYNKYIVTLSLKASRNFVFHYAIADSNMNVVATGSTYCRTSYMTATYSIRTFILPSNMLQIGNVYRMYYAFSAKGNLRFATGWGDLGICTFNPNTYTTDDCIQ